MRSKPTAFAHYWQVVGRGIVTTIAGLGVTLKYLFSRPITVEYPDVIPEIPEGWRGQHAFERDRCIKCRLCANTCPVQCITIDLEGKGKKAQLLRYEINYGTCLYCSLCTEVCPTECLWMTAEWDRAGYRREDSRVRLHTRDPEKERAKLWPSMKNSAVRLREKERKDKDETKGAAKDKSEAKLDTDGDKPKESTE